MINKEYILGINAFNIRFGGGVTHLVELLNCDSTLLNQFTKVVVWAPNETLIQLKDKKWLKKINSPYLNNKNIFSKLYWIFFKSNSEFNNEKIDILFIPGGTYLSRFRPYVTMNQNLLPFESTEILRYGLSFKLFKFLLLRFTQTLTNKNANGIIYLTPYAKNIVHTNLLKNTLYSIIPHGVNEKFNINPDQKKFRKTNEFTKQNPCKILYVSTIDIYKHQWNVVHAIYLLIKNGFYIKLILVGSPGTGSNKLFRAINKYDPNKFFTEYYPEVSYDKISDFYCNSDIGLFASSCETFGMILTESMSSSLPLACSNMSAIPDVIGKESCSFFNPLDINSIYNSVEKLYNDEDLRLFFAKNAFDRVQQFSWEKTTAATFSFLNKVKKNYQNAKK